MQAPSNPPAAALEIAGERRLRQFLCVLDLLAFAAIGAVALYLWRHWPKGRDVYFELQQGASLTYMLVWMGVALAAALAALTRKTRAVCIALSCLLLLEGLAHIYFYSANHRFYHPWAQVILNRFEPHPLLVGIPHPSRFGGLSHDDMHRRTTINEGKDSGAKLVYVFGGSSTYDIANIDAETWPSDLSRLLGPGFEVQNYGVPNYSSLEGMIQSLFVFRDAKPVCAVYYEGWNDLYNAHVDDLPSDYSRSQALRVLNTLALRYRPGVIASNWLLFQLIQRAVQQGPGYPGSGGTPSDQEDKRLSRIYTENIKLIADIDRHFGVKPIFIPQIMNYDFLETHQDWWWPYTPAKAVKPLMTALNLDLAHAADESGAVFVDAPLKVQWQGADFVDEGHFSAAGAARFAQAIAPALASSCE